MMQPLLDDRKNLSQIIVGAYEAAKKLEGVDTSNIAIMGYCFGGLVSLDLARSGVDLKGAVSFHGFLSGSEDLEDKDISAKLLVLHGHLDPMVGQDQIDSFSEEMNKKSVDWQLHSFGNAMHAFTNPDANDPSFGTVYSQDADQRSWKIFKDFLPFWVFGGPKGPGPPPLIAKTRKKCQENHQFMPKNVKILYSPSRSYRIFNVGWGFPT